MIMSSIWRRLKSLRRWGKDVTNGDVFMKIVAAILIVLFYYKTGGSSIGGISQESTRIVTVTWPQTMAPDMFSCDFFQCSFNDWSVKMDKSRDIPFYYFEFKWIWMLQSVTKVLVSHWFLIIGWIEQIVMFGEKPLWLQLTNYYYLQNIIPRRSLPSIPAEGDSGPYLICCWSLIFFSFILYFFPWVR